MFGLYLTFGAAAAQPGASRPALRDLPPELRQDAEKLASADAAERAAAACRLRAAGPHAAPAIPLLVELLGDETPVTPGVCGETSSWVIQNGIVQPSSPGKEAANALGEMGKPAVEPLIGALKSGVPAARKN